MEHRVQRLAGSKRKVVTEKTEGIEKAGSFGRPAEDIKSTKDFEKLGRSKSAPVKRKSGGFFDGVHAFFIAGGISRKRLQVWQTRFTELGGTILESDSASNNSCNLVHILAADKAVLSKELDLVKLKGYKKLRFVQLRWIEDCLKDGQLLSSELFNLLEGHGQGSTRGKESIQSILPEQSGLAITAAEKVSGGSVEGFRVSSEVANRTKSDGTLVRNSITETTQGVKNATKVPSSSMETEKNVLGIGEDEAPDYNNHVAGPLREMSNIYADVFEDEWRALTYRKVANKLNKLPYKITSAEELKNIEGIGISMIKKITEILCSGQLQKLASLKADPQVQTIQQFASVWGIGPKHARRLYQAGYKSLKDISQDPSLPSMAHIGLEYHHDIILPIPRAEVSEAGSFVKTVLEDLCPGAWLTVGGSYRRGQLMCGDIDLLITHPDGHSHHGLMSRLLGKLKDLEFLCGSPTASSQNNLHKADSFMGICRLPQHCHHRRIDIKIYPKDVYAFALVYFTGNDVLNRRVRYFAKTRGYKLSDQGLFLRVGNGKNGMASEVSIPCLTEEEVFEKLGLPYPEPQDRNW